MKRHLLSIHSLLSLVGRQIQSGLFFTARQPSLENNIRVWKDDATPNGVIPNKAYGAGDKMSRKKAYGDSGFNSFSCVLIPFRTERDGSCCQQHNFIKV